MLSHGADGMCAEKPQTPPHIEKNDVTLNVVLTLKIVKNARYIDIQDLPPHIKYDVTLNVVQTLKNGKNSNM